MVRLLMLFSISSKASEPESPVAKPPALSLLLVRGNDLYITPIQVVVVVFTAFPSFPTCNQQVRRQSSTPMFSIPAQQQAASCALACDRTPALRTWGAGSFQSV